MLWRWLLSLLILPILGWAPAVQADEPAPVVAVFLMESRGSPLSGDELVGLTDYLATRLGEAGRFQIIPREEIRRRLVSQQSDSYKDCYDRNCQIEVGRELAAQFTVTSTISKVGTKCLITAALFDLRTATTIKTASAKRTCAASQLIDAVEKISTHLEKAMIKVPPKPAETPVEPAPKDEPEAKKPVEKPADQDGSWKPTGPGDGQPAPPDPEQAGKGADGTVAAGTHQPDATREAEPTREPEPAREPEPKEEKDIPPPPPPPPPPPEPDDGQPRVFLGLGFAGQAGWWMSDGKNQDLYLGGQLALDFRLGSSFTLGLISTFQVSNGNSDYGFLGAGLRVGFLIDAAAMLKIHPWIGLGFAMQPTLGGDESHAIGFFGGGGVRALIMFTQNVGAQAEIAVDFAPLWYQEQEHDLLGLNFNAGLVLGF